MLRNSKKPKNTNSNELSIKFKKLYLTKREFSLSVHLSKVQKNLNERLYYKPKNTAKVTTEPNNKIYNYNYTNSLRTYQTLPDFSSRNVNKIFDERLFKTKGSEKNYKLELKNFNKKTQI